MMDGLDFLLPANIVWFMVAVASCLADPRGCG